MLRIEAALKQIPPPMEKDNVKGTDVKKKNVDKSVILDVLKKSIHDLLQSNELIDLLEIEDSVCTQNLCSAIEALFIHGHQKNQSVKLFSRLSGRKHSYEYDFWNFIKGFIPKNLINVLENYSPKLTPVGLSRVWLRFALNECTITSYIDSIRSDTKRLQHFYSKDSLIRDDEKMETFCGLLTSIERIPFNLDTKSSLLNTWINSDALKIAGIVVISSKSDNSDSNNLFDDHFSKTYDYDSISCTTNEENEEILTNSICSSKRYSSSVPKQEFLKSLMNNSFEQCDSVYEITNDNVTNDENEYKEIFEDSVLLKEISINEHCNSVGEIKDDNLPNDENKSKEIIDDSGLLKEISINEELFESLSNQISKDSCNEISEVNMFCEKMEIPSEDCENEIKITKNDDVVSNNFEDDVSNCKIRNDESYDQLWSQNTLITQTSIEPLNVSSNEKLEKSNSENSLNNLVNGSEHDSTVFNSDIVKQPKVYSSLIASKLITPTTDFFYNLLTRRFNLSNFTVKELDQPWELIGDEMMTERSEMKRLMDIFPGVDICSTNNGINSVFGGFCSKCSLSLETGKVFVDHYDGKLFCTNCHSGTKSVIPRNVIYNWDFEQKFVSQTTKRFLSEMMSHPNINLAEHSTLFDVIPELARVRHLRHKLNLLWLQVTSCNMETSKKMRETMFPRDYMLGNVKENDLYSLEDLIILQSGILEKTLIYVINKIAIPHVKKCLICRMKTMACDKCRDEKKRIYIHEIDEYCECSTPLCKSVIHKSCKSPTTVSFYCRRCVQCLENQQPITLDNYDSANYYD